ncbi:methyl farnesoate epoxidase-like [Phymastichus coffea]|uniref:methyl farnesoate epoxidase-like n=1 Tax=Phymastichus coffea TaxID=108790 RepID=UPI00273C5504|nr:methyl farnesoate epoxidase-like [Phymastichus coffea]
MWLLPLLMLLLLLLLPLLLLDLAMKRRAARKNYPPGPMALPIVGNLHQVVRLVKQTRFHWGAWSRLSQIYGPVLKIRLGMAKPLIVVSGREAVLDVLLRRDFDGRPDTYETRHRCLGRKRGIVLNDGQDWCEQRRFLLKILKDFGFGKQSMEELTLEDAAALCDIIHEKMLDRPIDIHEFCQVTAVAVISSLWSLIAGKRCDPSEENSEVKDILSILNESFRNGSATGALWQHLPILRRLVPKYSGFAEQDRRVSAMSKYFLDEVARHKLTRVQGEPRDLIDHYLDEIGSRCGSGESSSYDELQLSVLLKDMFSAGIETTSNAIGFAIAYLAKYPEAQRRVRAELDQVIGSAGVPKLAYKNSLPYLSATIAEVSRLANIAPTTIAHRAVVDCSLMGYDVEKDWSLIANLRSVHMDPDHWVDSEAFRPDRFIDGAGHFVEDPWLIPFGAGRRKCLGENLARMSLFVFVASLLQKFRFGLAPNETAPCMLGVNGFTVAPPHVNVLIASRSCGSRDNA